MAKKLLKNRWDLIPLKTVELGVEAFTYGAGKYHDNDWKEYKSDVYLAAMFRHLVCIEVGEECDEESGLSHLSHYLADCIMYTHLKKKELKEAKECQKS